MAGIARFMQAITLRDTTQPFDRLVRFNWRGQLLITFVGMLVSFLVAGFWYPYWRIADMDLWVIYNALLLNDHLPQLYFDHPGYLPILLLSYWLRVLHGIGLIRVDSLSGVPPVSDFSAFGAVLMQLTQAGRVLSLLLAMGLVAAFAYLLRAFIRDPRIAGLGGFLFAFSGGLEMQMRTLRTELLAAGLFTIALLMLLIAAKRGPSPWRPSVVGIAAALITLGMQSKVQVFFLICALPLLMLSFGPDLPAGGKPRQGFWQTPSRGWPALAASAAIALGAAYLARNLISVGLTEQSGLPSIGLDARAYWALLVVWIGLGMGAYCALWRVAALEALAAAFCAVAGCMIGLLALYIRYHPRNAVVVFHPLEAMFAWAAASDPRLATGSTLFSAARVQFLLHAIAGVIARRTFFLHSSPRPTIFLEWVVIAATVIAVRRRQWRLVMNVAALMLTDWGVDVLGMGRRLQASYFLFTDPLVIIAAALLIARIKDLQQHRWTYPVGVALIALHVIVSQAEPVKNLFRTAGLETLCYQQYRFPRFGPLAFCPPQPAAAQ